MSEEQTKPIDPMEQSCDDIDISFPLVPAANYPMSIKDITRTLSKKAKEAGEVLDLNNLNSGMLEITWENSTEIQSTKNETLEPGRIALKTRISLVPTEKTADKNAYTIGDIKKAVAKLVRATGLKGVNVADVIRNPSILKGRDAVVKVKVKPETADYAESNDVKDYVIED